MNNNTVIKNKELPLFSSLSNIEGDHNNIFDNSTEFSWIYWLFDTVNDSKNESTIEVCGLQNVYLSFRGDLSFRRDFLEVDEDMEPLHLDVLENNFNQLITYEASRITDTNRLLEIETNNKNEDSRS
ncbi:hypothetical protein C2G38_2167804 [Gigaspora rosea]|uniref:Uncharacterized protein n=1 Tax=Gigaspora rosea TaxID=44941 RepID=A0A397W0A4_9GLOM|nr:hypothetical protein C2G38_2167804 [Gigaspora rosea]